MHMHLLCSSCDEGVWLCGQAYADYYDVMALTEELVSGLVKSVTGSFQIQYHASKHLPTLTLHTVPLMVVCCASLLSQAFGSHPASCVVDPNL